MRAATRVAFARLHEGRCPPATPSSPPAPADGTVIGRRHAGHPGEHVHGRARHVADVPAVAGDIATVVGLADAEIGDQLGAWDAAYGGRLFAAPGLESVVRARDPGDRGRLFAALQQLAAQDPLIDARLDGPDEELTVNLYGEVQRRCSPPGWPRSSGSSRTSCPPAPSTSSGSRAVGDALGQGAVRQRQRRGAGRARARRGPGGRYRMGTERGYLLPSFHHAVEETVPAVLTRGPARLAGRRLLGVPVRRTLQRADPAGRLLPRAHHAHAPRGVRPGGHRTVCEPVSSFETEAPAERDQPRPAAPARGPRHPRPARFRLAGAAGSPAGSRPTRCTASSIGFPS